MDRKEAGGAGDGLELARGLRFAQEQSRAQLEVQQVERLAQAQGPEPAAVVVWARARARRSELVPREAAATPGWPALGLGPAGRRMPRGHKRGTADAWPASLDQNPTLAHIELERRRAAPIASRPHAPSAKPP